MPISSNGLESRRLSRYDFEQLRNAYIRENQLYPKALIFRVGGEAGFYSEVGTMLECMMFCFVNGIQFRLYSDDSSFQAAGRGWQQFFEPFCIDSHSPLNRFFNVRQPPRLRELVRRPFIFDQGIVGNINRLVSPFGRKVLLRSEKANYLMGDYFKSFASTEFRDQWINWPLFNMNGKVFFEIAKLMSFVLRYNDSTFQRISDIRASLNLPDDYISIQMRGGDKIASMKSKKYQYAGDTGSPSFYIKKLEDSGKDFKNIFILSDDFRHVEAVQAAHPEWNVYTLTTSDERGYVHQKFKSLDWNVKERMLVKLFCAVEICIDSSFHFGHEVSSPTKVIRALKPSSKYQGMLI
jgi:hypothetical protein